MNLCHRIGRFAVFFVLLSSSVYAAQLPEDSAVENPQGNLEEILNALNDSIKENKQLRDNMQTMQQALERVTVENNVLKTRIRTLEEKVTETGQDKQGARNMLEEEVEKVEKLQGQLSENERVMAELKDQTAQLKNENEELKTMLNRSILKEEKESYDRMISEVRGKSEKALEMISEDRFKTEQMKEDLENAHFILGNILFDKKNYQGAERHYQRVLESNPDHYLTHHNLGVIYDYYFRDRPIAIYHYKKYLDLKPLDEEAAEIRERVLQAELTQKVVPTQPLKLEFNQYHKENL